MSEPKFTPGPWRANIYSRDFYDTGEYYTEYTVESPLNICVCQVFEHDNNQHTGEEQASANAALIAAAPEMYADEIMLCNELDSLFHCFEQSCLGVKFSPGEIEKRRDRIIAALNKSGETLKKARGEVR